MGFPFPIFIKASRSRISVSKEIREVNRLRLQFERSMTARLMAVFKRVGKRAADEYKQSESVSEALRPLEGELEQVFRAHYRAVIEKFGDRVYENRKQERFAQLLFSYYSMEGAQKVRGVTTQTANLIRRAIRAGEVEGEGVANIAKRIREKTDGAIGRARSSTIARTETHAAASYATHEATKELGLPAQRKRWVSVSDGRTRSHHVAANGQEVGMDEPFIIRFKGQEIRMMYPHDGSGGPANNINCRCLALYFSDEDAIFDDFADGVVEPVAAVAPEPEQDVGLVGPFAVLRVSDQFLRPNKSRFTNENFPKIKRDEAQKRLDEGLEASAADERYNKFNRFRGMSEKNWGVIKNSRGLSDDALAMVAVITDELNYLSDFLKIPRLRGYEVQKMKAVASQGDGVMNLNPAYFNRYAEDMRSDVDRVAAKKRFDAAASEDVALQKEISVIKEKRRVFEVQFSNDEIGVEEFRAAVRPMDDEISEIRIRRNRLSIEMRKDKRWVVSEWSEDSKLTKPYTSDGYFEAGIDHMRSTMYHEFGHHIHQYYKAEVLSGRIVAVPTETQLKRFFQKNFKLRKKRSQVLSTTYAEQDPYEFFAEQFSLFSMGKVDKVTPQFMELIREIADERTI